MSVTKLFTERFRPGNLDDLILPDRIRNEIGNGLKQNYLLHGEAGTGKTSAAKVLTKDYPTLYINASDETGVDVIRTKITDWCSTISVLDGKEAVKCIILDEIDFASANFFAALRASLEKFTGGGDNRFIATCNFINKIPVPIQDRFACINFNPVSKEEEKELKIKYVQRTLAITKGLGITMSKEAVIEFVKRNFPSMRSIVSKIQSFHDKGIKKIEAEDIKVLNYSFDDIFKMVTGAPDPYNNYVLLMSQYASKVDDVLASLGTEFPEYLREFHPNKVDKLPQILIEVANYQSIRNSVIDPAITMLAAALKIQMILNS